MDRTVLMYGWMKSSMILRLRRNSVRDMAKLKTLHIVQQMPRLEFSVPIECTADSHTIENDLPKSEKLRLALLHVSEGLRKPRGRVLQTVGALSEQVVRGGVEGVPEEQRSHVDDPAAAGRVAPAEEADEFLDMLLEDFRVDDAIPHEHGTDELARA